MKWQSARYQSRITNVIVGRLQITSVIAIAITDDDDDDDNGDNDFRARYKRDLRLASGEKTVP